MTAEARRDVTPEKRQNARSSPGGDWGLEALTWEPRIALSVREDERKLREFDRQRS